MSDISFQTALSNINTFNEAKKEDRVGNFSGLKVEEGKVSFPNSTHNAARFAATFFSLGIFQKYRNDNKVQSLEVQKILNQSVEVLLNTTEELSEDEKKQRETALKTFNVVLFECRTTFVPPSFIVRFYYWVLGLNNQLITQRHFAFSSDTRTQLSAINTAVAQHQAQEYRAIEDHGTPLALTFGTNKAVSEEDGTVSLSNLSQSYVDFVSAVLTVQEKGNIQGCGCSTSVEYEANRKKVQDAQDQAVAKNINTFVEVWKASDVNLVKAAAKAGYVQEDAAQVALDNYYSYLSSHADQAAFLRRNAEKEMSTIALEASVEFQLEMFASIEKKELPAFMIPMKSSILGSGSVQTKSLMHQTFLGMTQKMSTKVREKFNEAEFQPLIEYQAMMLGLKTFGLIEQVLKMMPLDAVLSKISSNPITTVTPADKEFAEAFAHYGSVVTAEQQVNLEFMKQLSQGEIEEITGEEYKAKAAQVFQSRGRQEVISRLPSSPKNVMQLPDLNINSFGIAPNMNDPILEKLTKSYMNVLMKEMVSFSFYIAMHPVEFVDKIQASLPSGSRRISELERRSTGGMLEDS